jgi:hypothetical protein
MAQATAPILDSTFSDVPGRPDMSGGKDRKWSADGQNDAIGPEPDITRF